MKTAEMNQAESTSGLVLHKAAVYDLLLSLLTLGREGSFREQALRLAQLKEGESVLDVGCGTGTLAVAASRHVGATGNVSGIDASSEMIARAVKKAQRAKAQVDFRIGLVESLPFTDGAFDAVLSTVMLHHLPPKLRHRCAAEIHRVLKPGGRLLAVDFATSSAQNKGIIAHFHRHGNISIDEIVSILANAGFRIVQSGELGFGDLQFALAMTPPPR